VQAMVGAGLGVAIVPHLAADLNDPSSVAIPLDDVVPARPLGVVWHRDRYRSPAALAFVDVASEVCEDFAAEPVPAALTARPRAAAAGARRSGR
jgi:DNA-binding transcriptional LysR family regulator